MVPLYRTSKTMQDFTSWQRIGRGGFGKVYKARPHHPHLYHNQGWVAIKVMDKRQLRDSAAELRMATEVAIHETLEHPHILRVYDSFEDDRFVYLVMELCEEGDLWRYLRQRSQLNEPGALGCLTEKEAQRVIGQVAEALVYLHRSNVLHRDLKLANIMLKKDKGELSIRLGDLGLATWINDRGLMEPKTMCGTPSYICPEIMARQPYGYKADVWALGCLLVTVLTGRQPFRDTGRITERLVAQVGLPRGLSQEGRSLVRDLLRVDPRQRMRTEELLEHPWFAEKPRYVLKQPANTGGFSTKGLPPMKRSLKNGKIYLRQDRWLVLDLQSSPTLVALDETSQQIHEFRRPQRIDRLSAQMALHTYRIDQADVPEHIGKVTRVAYRCVEYLLSQQKRIKIKSPQGTGWVMMRGEFKFQFFNGIRVDQTSTEATVEIPSNERGMPNEIQKIQLSRELGGKMKGILEHTQEAQQRAEVFGDLLGEFEEGGQRHKEYQGQIQYPVEAAWDWDGAEYVPDGLIKKSALTTQSSTMVTKRPLGHITRLVEEFKQPNFLRTPANPLLIRTPQRLRDNNKAEVVHEMAQSVFDNACFMDGVGWCTAVEGRDLEDYLITILFCDGCRVFIRARDHLCHYRDADGRELQNVRLDHTMPSHVRERVSWLPQFLDLMGLST